MSTTIEVDATSQWFPSAVAVENAMISLDMHGEEGEGDACNLLIIQHAHFLRRLSSAHSYAFPLDGLAEIHFALGLDEEATAKAIGRVGELLGEYAEAWDFCTQELGGNDRKLIWEVVWQVIDEARDDNRQNVVQYLKKCDIPPEDVQAYASAVMAGHLEFHDNHGHKIEAFIHPHDVINAQIESGASPRLIQAWLTSLAEWITPHVRDILKAEHPDFTSNLTSRDLSELLRWGLAHIVERHVEQVLEGEADESVDIAPIVLWARRMTVLTRQRRSKS